ncbi:MAG: hypothetical protein ABR990_14610 [Terracidiphilus sp.]
MSRVVVLSCIGIVLLMTHDAVGQQTSPSQPSKSATRSNKPAQWIDNKVSIHVERPHLNTSGYLVLNYTVTNNSKKDINIDFSEPLISSPFIPQPTKVYLKLKSPESYLQQSPNDNFLRFQTTSLPVGLPVRLIIVVGSSGHNQSSWFSHESDEDRLWKAVNDEVGNVTTIDLFIPDQRLKISLPIPKR